MNSIYPGFSRAMMVLALCLVSLPAQAVEMEALEKLKKIQAI